jgi:serpin B
MKTRLLLIVALVFSAACSQEGNKIPDVLPDAEPITLRAALTPKIDKDNSFAFDLFRHVYQSDKSSNIFISPLSVSMALSMTLNGAVGETREEMEKAMQLAGFSPDEINEYCKTLREALLKVDPSSEFAIANSIWYRTGLKVEDDFLKTNRESFAAEVNEADFTAPATLKRINKWCADNTNNRIPEILDGIPGDAVMYLINAVYFKAIWRMKFDKGLTSDRTFKREDGSMQTVSMMRQVENFNYSDDEVAAYLRLPYGNGAFDMLVALPHEGKTVDELVDHLGEGKFNPKASGLSTEVNLQLPRFKTECKYDLKNVLMEMGMRSAFADADFSGITRNAPIRISRVIHKTFVEVDEEGTEAAAVTAVEMELTSAGPRPPVNFIVDKPFVFMIRENSTGVILFIGAIKDIKN